MMHTPPFLSKGDKIAIVAPARKLSKEEMQPAIDILQSWGLEVVLGKHLFHSSHQFSGTDDERLSDMQQMLDDNSIKAIIAARGGYGTVRLIDRIDFTHFTKNPKWIIGYSDATVLHAHIQSNYRIKTMHATMPINFSNNTKEAINSLKEALFGRLPNYSFSNHPLNRDGKARAELVGGNLSILYSLTGTSSSIDTKGKMLFLEDLDEYLYHIDRMMLNLKRSGMLEGLAALVVGGMTDMNDNAIPYGKTAYQIIRDIVEEYNYPVCFGFPAGHIDDNRALILGQEMEVEVTPQTCSLHCT